MEADPVTFRDSRMRFQENRTACRGVREFYNLDPLRMELRPGHIDLGWSFRIVQKGI